MGNLDHVAKDIRVLIADDYALTRSMVQSILKGVGFTNMTEADNGASAMRKLDEEDIGLVICDWNMPEFTGLDVLFAALGSELFPTSYRSTASGVRAAVATLGGALGLWLEGSLFAVTGSHSEAITLMLAAVLVSPLLVALFLPESARLELEEISPERAAT